MIRGFGAESVTLKEETESLDCWGPMAASLCASGIWHHTCEWSQEGTAVEGGVSKAGDAI